MARRYKRDSKGQFASTGAAGKDSTKKVNRKLRRKARNALKNSAGRRRISIAGGKSIAVFIGGTRRSTGRLFKKKKDKK